MSTSVLLWLLLFPSNIFLDTSHQKQVRVGFTVKQSLTNSYKDSPVYVSTFSLAMEIEALTPVLWWTVSRSDSLLPHILSSSWIPWACYKKWQVEWETQTSIYKCPMFNIHLKRLQWMYYPVHDRVKGSDWADRLAGEAAITSGLNLGRSEVLNSLRHYQWAHWSQIHHTFEHLEERGTERGTAWWSFWKGWEKVIVNQTNIWTVSKAMCRKCLRCGTQRGLPSI